MAASSAYVRKAWASDAEYLARNMRDSDRLEVIASDGPNVYETVLYSIKNSEECNALFIDGQMACVWGVARAPDGVECFADGVVWMLSTDVVDKKPKTFWRLCRTIAPELFSRWGVLVNAIDVRHEKAIRWGKRLGFRFAKVAPLGIDGQQFALFSVGD